MGKISADKWVRQIMAEGITFCQVPEEVDITDVRFTPEWRSPGTFVYPDSYYWDATVGFLELITEEEDYERRMMMFNEEVKQARWKLGLTQKQLSQILGCTEHTVQNWESGRTSPKFSVVLACRWLQEHPEYVEAAREMEGA